MIGNFIGAGIGEPLGTTSAAASAPVWFGNMVVLPELPSKVNAPPQPAAVFRGDDGVYQRFEVFRNYGFHVQPWQPPQRNVKRNTAAIFKGDDGNQVTFQRFFDYGFHVQPWQPPTPSRQIDKFAGTVGGHPGIDDILRQPLQTADYKWFETNYVFPRKNFARAAAILKGDDGTQGTYYRWFDYGFHIQPWQPPTPTARWEKQAAMVGGDPGNQARFEVFRNRGWEIQPWQPPNYRQRFDASAIFEGDDGNQGQYISWKDYGFHVQPWQPPTPTSQWKKGALLRGDNTADLVTFKTWVNDGWEVQYTHLPRRRHERWGAIQATVGEIPWRTVPVLLTSAYAWGYTQGAIDYRRTQRFRAAALMRGHDGIEARFSFVHIPETNLRIVYTDVSGREVSVSIGGRIVYVDVHDRVILADTTNRGIDQ